MSFFSWFASKHPRIAKPSSTFDDSDIQWIKNKLEHASTFLAVCFIHFDFDETSHTISCYRGETHNQSRLELGRLERVSAKKWERFWTHVCHSTGQQRHRLTPLEGEKSRELIIWTSPGHSTDTYSVTPNSISIKLCIDYPNPSIDQSSNCSLDGPCTCC